MMILFKMKVARVYIYDVLLKYVYTPLGSLEYFIVCLDFQNYYLRIFDLNRIFKNVRQFIWIYTNTKESCKNYYFPFKCIIFVIVYSHVFFFLYLNKMNCVLFQVDGEKALLKMHLY